MLGIMVDVNLLHKANPNGQDLDYLEIIVEPYPSPISYKGQYHYRSGSTKQALKSSALDTFLLQMP
jgi:ATP-dependent DNA helicase RecG